MTVADTVTDVNITTLISAFALSFLLACAALAQDSPADPPTDPEISADEVVNEDFWIDREGERCINTRNIRDTDIIDERTILFELRGGDFYVNYLRNACRSLLREERFSYRTTGGRLCNVDSIRVLEQFGGSIQEGMSCGLGMFFPITEEEAEFIALEPEERRGRPRIEVRNPNAEGAGDENDDEAAGDGDDAEAADDGDDDEAGDTAE